MMHHGWLDVSMIRRSTPRQMRPRTTRCNSCARWHRSTGHTPGGTGNCCHVRVVLMRVGWVVRCNWHPVMSHERLGRRWMSHGYLHYTVGCLVSELLRSKNRSTQICCFVFHLTKMDLKTNILHNVVAREDIIIRTIYIISVFIECIVTSRTFPRISSKYYKLCWSKVTANIDHSQN